MNFTPSPKRKQHSRVLSFGLLIAGAVFLCTPNFNLFDLLPDALGYAFLLLAVRNASEVFPHFDTAYRHFYSLFWINLAKIPALFVMLGVTGTDLTERPLITVFALSFAVVEWIFAIPAFRALFEGFVYIGEREGVTRALYAREEKSVDKLTLLTLVFLIVKGALSFLPECLYLSTFEHKGSLEPGAINPMAFYPVVAVFGILISLVFGLVWLFSLIPYFRALGASDEMRTLLLSKEATLKDKLDEQSERRRLRFFFGFLALGFLLAIDPLIENRDLLPNILASLAFFLAFSFIGEERIKRVGHILSLGYFVLAALENVFSALFFKEFVHTDIAFRDAALVRYIPVVLLRLLESGLFFFTVFLVLKYLRIFTVRYTGRNLRDADLVSGNALHKELFFRIRRLGIYSAVYALLRPVSAVLMAVTSRHIITEDEANEFYAEGAIIYSSEFAWLWIVLLVGGIALAAYAISLFGELKREAGLAKEDE